MPAVVDGQSTTMPFPRHPNLRRVFAALALIAALVGASLLLQDVFGALTEHIAAYERQRPFAGLALFVLLAAASVVLGPFSSAPLMPFAVGVWGTEKTLALLFLGWAIGNAFAYGVGWFLGYPIVARIVSAEKLDRWMRFVHDDVRPWMLFLLRLAAPAEIGYAFGILKYRFRTYLAIVLAAEVPFALIVVYGGDAFIEGRWVTLAAFAAGALILMGVAWFLFSNANSARQHERETPPPSEVAKE